ncbi:MAG: ABC-2 family transporter protein [Eubacteriales bacterium]|jgi:ABC-2 type transport system permease protein|nr:ABC-2 family transporter protein [Eubacteriales bacterium]
MKKYLAFFRIRFINGLQYRAAAYAGMATQFAWGFMEILVYTVFHDTAPAAFPMEMGQLTSYIWLRQALLGLFMSWYYDRELLDMITSGNVAYEMCRPADIYTMWFAKNLATRCSRAALRCVPIFLVAGFLPGRFRLYPPAGAGALAMFCVSVTAGVLITVGLSMFVYATAFYTVSPLGMRIVAVNIIEFMSGGIIPLPFFPDGVFRVMRLLPFAATESTPFLIYSGALRGGDAGAAVALQFMWLVLITAGGKLYLDSSLRRLVIQGG